MPLLMKNLELPGPGEEMFDILPGSDPIWSTGAGSWKHCLERVRQDGQDGVEFLGVMTRGGSSRMTFPWVQLSKSPRSRQAATTGAPSAANSRPHMRPRPRTSRDDRKTALENR